MALARRALLLAFVAVCALLLAVGVVGPGEPPRDHGATDAVVATATPGASPALITSVAKHTSPLVLIATSETAAARRGRHRLRPVDRRGRGHRRGRRPAPRPGGGSGTPTERAGQNRGCRAPDRRVRPGPTARVDEQLTRLVLELEVFARSFRY